MKRELFLSLIDDCVSDLIYYDRKEDEDLSIEDVEEIIDDGLIEEATKRFKESLLNFKLSLR